MLALRLLIMVLSYSYILSHFRRGGILFTELMGFLLSAFWFIIHLGFSLIYIFLELHSLCLLRTFCLELREFFAVAICSFYLRHRIALFMLFSQIKYGVILLGLSIICFVVNPGPSQEPFT